MSEPGGSAPRPDAPTLAITLAGGGDCRVHHVPTGTTIETSKSPAFGGSGRSLSSTDLLAAALGSCIATDIEPVAIRHGVPLEHIRIYVDKRLSLSPKRIESFTVRIVITAPVEASIRARLRNAADACLVQRSLDAAIRCDITLETGPAPPEPPRP